MLMILLRLIYASYPLAGVEADVDSSLEEDEVALGELESQQNVTGCPPTNFAIVFLSSAIWELLLLLL
jgi:hypothetical protein